MAGGITRFGSAWVVTYYQPSMSSILRLTIEVRSRPTPLSPVRETLAAQTVRAALIRGAYRDTSTSTALRVSKPHSHTKQFSEYRLASFSLACTNALSGTRIGERSFSRSASDLWHPSALQNSKFSARSLRNMTNQKSQHEPDTS